jgi:uncharacterized protein
MANTRPHDDLYPHIAYRCIVGSRAYGLDHADSDTDRRGWYLPPAERHWSLTGVPEQLEDGEETYWEVGKFVTMALKANPNVLECLYTPLVEYAAPIAQELRDRRSIFISRRIYQTYNGYAASQFHKLNKDMQNHGAIRWKHAMHLIRLLLNGIDALYTGKIPVLVTAERERLLAIRRGEMSWEAVNAWRLALHADFDAAYAVTALPVEPDTAAADAWLIRARRSAL